MPTLGRTMARSLLVLILVCVSNCSTSPKRHSPTKFKELPVPVRVEPEAPLPTPEPSFYKHRVRWPGETLSIIAQWYTGSWKNWKALSNANPKLNPNRIFINDNILIPEDLLKSHKPMPLSFLSSSIRKKSVQSSQSKKPSNENDVTEMFEPIEADLPSIESGKVELFEPIE
jgi:hypothetical protein